MCGHGHGCCRLPRAEYHEHLVAPDACRWCHEGARQAIERISVERLVADVLARIAPWIPDLPPEGPELAEQVRRVAQAVHRAAGGDPRTGGIPAGQLRTVLAGRVGVALALGQG